MSQNLNTWCGRFVYKNINNKITTHNLKGVEPQNYVSVFIKLFEIKYNLI
jgi:hypothetical protein